MANEVISNHGLPSIFDLSSTSRSQGSSRNSSLNLLLISLAYQPHSLVFSPKSNFIHIIRDTFGLEQRALRAGAQALQTGILGLIPDPLYLLSPQHCKCGLKIKNKQTRKKNTFHILSVWESLRLLGYWSFLRVRNCCLKTSYVGEL